MAFSALPAVSTGLQHLAQIGLPDLGGRISAMVQWTLEQLSQLRHDSGEPLVRIYGPSNTENRGRTIAMNLFDRTGRWIPHQMVEAVAAQQRISIRTGCFCNPGVAEQTLGYSRYSQHPAKKLGGAYIGLANTVGIDCLLSKITPFTNPVGMVRASVGIASNFEDVWQWIEMLRAFIEPQYVDQLGRTYEANFSPPHSLC